MAGGAASGRKTGAKLSFTEESGDHPAVGLVADEIDAHEVLARNEPPRERARAVPLVTIDTHPRSWRHAQLELDPRELTELELRASVRGRGAGRHLRGIERPRGIDAHRAHEAIPGQVVGTALQRGQGEQEVQVGERARVQIAAPQPLRGGRELRERGDRVIELQALVGLERDRELWVQRGLGVARRGVRSDRAAAQAQRLGQRGADLDAELIGAGRDPQPDGALGGWARLHRTANQGRPAKEGR